MGLAALLPEERAMAMTVPFLLSEEQIGAGLPEEFKARILEIRRAHAPRLVADAEGLFQPIDGGTFIPRLSILENALYGKVSLRAGAKAEQIEDLVAAVLDEHGLRKRLAVMLFDLPIDLGGSNLPPLLQERAAFSRAAIKRPDILILDRALASQDAQSRLEIRERLQKLMPQTTMIFNEDHFAHPERYDLYVEIKDGRIDGVQREAAGQLSDQAAEDLGRKLAVIAGAELFQNLDTRNQRLLAFSAQWHQVAAGTRIFSRGDGGDAVYLCLGGQAELRWPGHGTGDEPVSTVEPGRLIGDLAVILNQPRQLDLVAVADSCFLRIGAEEFRAVMESDAGVAVQLLKTVSGHLVEVADYMLQENLKPMARADGGTARPLPIPAAE
jgi:putative ABC transport system ATP-binding protein